MLWASAKYLPRFLTQRGTMRTYMLLTAYPRGVLGPIKDVKLWRHPSPDSTGAVPELIFSTTDTEYGAYSGQGHLVEIKHTRFVAGIHVDGFEVIISFLQHGILSKHLRIVSCPTKIFVYRSADDTSYVTRPWK